ncbi:MAG: hypothetical protein V1854_00455 [Methanobacteriota archaeon]
MGVIGGFFGYYGFIALSKLSVRRSIALFAGLAIAAPFLASSNPDGGHTCHADRVCIMSGGRIRRAQKTRCFDLMNKKVPRIWTLQQIGLNLSFYT